MVGLLNAAKAVSLLSRRVCDGKAPMECGKPLEPVTATVETAIAVATGPWKSEERQWRDLPRNRTGADRR